MSTCAGSELWRSLLWRIWFGRCWCSLPWSYWADHWSFATKYWFGSVHRNGWSFGGLKAVLFAKELSLFRVIIQGDCIRIIDALKGSGHCHTLYGQVIDETNRLGGMLRSCMFQHVRREGNRLAHSLAKNTVLSADTDVWVKSLSEDVKDIFQSDLPWTCFIFVGFS